MILHIIALGFSTKNLAVLNFFCLIFKLISIKLSHLKRKRICGYTLASNCPSSTHESNRGSNHDLGAARSNATGSITLQQEWRRPVCDRYVCMYGASAIWMSSSETCRLLANTPGGMAVKLPCAR